MRVKSTGRASHAQSRKASVCRNPTRHAGQAFRHRVPGTQEESLGLLSPAMRAGMPTERSALTRNMLSPVQEAYPAAITCIRQVVQPSRSDRPVPLFSLWQGQLARKTVPPLSAGLALWRGCRDSSIAHLGWGHDVWSLISPEGDVPDWPDVLVEQQGCLRDACGAIDQRAEALMEERPPVVSHLIHADIESAYFERLGEVVCSAVSEKVQGMEIRLLKVPLPQQVTQLSLVHGAVS